MPRRLISLSRTGRYATVRTAAGLDVVDALGTSPRTQIPGPIADFACVGTMVWVLTAGGRSIGRFALATGRSAQPALALPRAAVALIASPCTSTHAVIASGDGHVFAHDTAVSEIAHELGACAAFPLGGRRIAMVEGGVLQVIELGRRDALATVPVAGEIRSVHALYGGNMIAVLSRGPDEDLWTVLRPDGTRVRQVAVPRLLRWAVAGEAGIVMVVLGDGRRWCWIDIRDGVTHVSDDAPFVIDDLAISTDARHVLFATAEGDEPQVMHVAAADLLARGRRPLDAVAAEPAIEAALSAEPSQAALASQAAAAVVSARASEPPAPPEPALSTVVPRALGEPTPPLEIAPASGWPPYGAVREHLDDMLDLVAARAARAIADGRNSGRLAITGDRRIEHEIRALIGDGDVPALAPGELARADDRVTQATARAAGRVRTTIASGISLPFVDLMRELDLSAFAGHILMVVIAAAERCEIARLFRILADDPERSLVDRGVLDLVLAGSDSVARAAISAELAEGAPLRRFGALHVTGDSALAAITADSAIIERCCGRAPAARAVRALGTLSLDRAAHRDLCDAVAMPRARRDPLRLVLRGRPGSGRRSVITALAAQLGRAIAELDCARLPRDGAAMALALQHELRRAVLRGRIPVISELELADAADREGQDRLRLVVRSHPGPIVFRTGHESQLPIDPGAQTVVLPTLSETSRGAFWRTALARAGMTAPDVDGLAARWRIAPGQIEDVIAQVKARPSATFDDVSRAHIATRLGHVATPIRRLAAWEDVALPDEMIDSVRELIGRAAHRKTVLDEWGFDAKVASSRGLTALFYGPPGTGKTMVAGLIARELGLELYRVDLSRIVSKWIGETEKNLGEVFDAAEDGQVVILFDEADSLFGKRTDVKSSNDRYANLEVNYILQRLDSFEGIAILTTNLDGSIDPAFKRRMSMRLQFPFPDEDSRARLWAAHIPTTAPTANDFDFPALARRFPLSGGYIRNSALRAAFIAAQERRPLSQAHLLRAVVLEYRELGQLANSGKLE